MEPGRQRNGGVKSVSKRDMLAAGVGPVHRADILEWVLASNLHDVDLPAGRPSDTADRISQHPERRPDALTLGYMDAGSTPGVDTERSTTLVFEASRRVCAPS